MELFTMTLADNDEEGDDEHVVGGARVVHHHILTRQETQAVIDAVEAESAAAGDA